MLKAGDGDGDGDGAVAVAAVPCGRRVDNFFAVVAAANVAVFSSTCLSVVGFSCCEMLIFFLLF